MKSGDRKCPLEHTPDRITVEERAAIDAWLAENRGPRVCPPLAFSAAVQHKPPSKVSWDRRQSQLRRKGQEV